MNEFKKRLVHLHHCRGISWDHHLYHPQKRSSITSSLQKSFDKQTHLYDIILYKHILNDLHSTINSKQYLII